MKFAGYAAAWLLCGLPAMCLAAKERAPSASFDAVVTRVVDGDTVWLKSGGAKPVKARLEGLDAPEICQAGGPASRAALAGHVLHQRVRVAVYGRDDYDRLIARLSVAGRSGAGDVGAWMVGSGQAWSYRYRWNAGPYAAEQRQAEALRRGLFAGGSPEEPRSFRKRHGPCEWPSR